MAAVRVDHRPPLSRGRTLRHRHLCTADRSPLALRGAHVGFGDNRQSSGSELRRLGIIGSTTRRRSIDE
jgi:hypothetical protein